MTSDTLTVGSRLRQARTLAGFKSCAQAARALGLAPSTIRSHERGQNGLSAQAASRYAEHYGVEPVWLLYGDGQPARQDPDHTLARAKDAERKLDVIRNALRRLLTELGDPPG